MRLGMGKREKPKKKRNFSLENIYTINNHRSCQKKKNRLNVIIHL